MNYCQYLTLVSLHFSVREHKYENICKWCPRWKKAYISKSSLILFFFNGFLFCFCLGYILWISNELEIIFKILNSKECLYCINSCGFYSNYYPIFEGSYSPLKYLISHEPYWNSREYWFWVLHFCLHKD